jgi:phosphatidylethanolamine/phosphatidyl-N-methylethanolamine N-methyltransferase
MPATFVLNYLRTPRLTGALAPSSRGLAEAMAAAVGTADHILELGAGTGSITAALKRRHPGVPLTLVEQDPLMAKRLQARFPDADLVVDFLHNQTARLAELPKNTVMVSSLPFRAFDSEMRDLTAGLICDFLAQGSTRKLIQYTYLPQIPFNPDRASLKWTKRKQVLANLPPAQVWELMLDI